MTASVQPAFALRRCRNHLERQAACRCPGCGFDFCRECVTEHDQRLLCSRCVAALAASGGKTRQWKTLSKIGYGVAGILAAWVFFFLAGEFVSATLSPRHEVRDWHAH